MDGRVRPLYTFLTAQVSPAFLLEMPTVTEHHLPSPPLTLLLNRSPLRITQATHFYDGPFFLDRLRPDRRRDCRVAKPNEYMQPPPPAVTVAQPVERECLDELEFTGTTRATEAVDVRARVNGYLQKIDFADGADVQAGDVLFVIEPAPFEAALDVARRAAEG